MTAREQHAGSAGAPGAGTRPAPAEWMLKALLLTRTEATLLTRFSLGHKIQSGHWLHHEVQNWRTRGSEAEKVKEQLRPNE